MGFTSLVRRSLVHYWRTNAAVTAGVAVAVAVVAGALVVGESVRASLRDLALSRLGAASLLVSTPTTFRERLAADLGAEPRFSEAFAAVCPILALEGSVVHEPSGRAAPVHIFGVDDRFWSFHGLGRRWTEGPRGMRDALVSAALSQELGVAVGEPLRLRLEKPSAVPAGFLHGNRDEAGRTVRLTVRGTLAAGELGEFALRPRQGSVRAVFVPLARLQRDLDIGEHVNALLVSERRAAGTLEDGRRSAAALEAILRGVVTPEDLGVKVRVLDGRGLFALESAAIVMTDAVAGAALGAARDAGLEAQPVLVYLVNGIRLGKAEIPYSLVAGVPGSPVLLNEWAAGDLGARAGDEVTLEYYVWLEQGRLATRRASFRVSGVLSMSDGAIDRDIAPEYPGITEAGTLGDWNPPFPVDLSRVRPQDEEYWKRHRTTPKMVVPLADAQALWRTRYGAVTSIRMKGSPDEARAFGERLRRALAPATAGVAVVPVRAEALAASQGATDFGAYFLYFSFFLMGSALLLTGLFFRLGVEQRLREVGTLRALGYTMGRIRGLFLAEGAVLAAAGALLGTAGAAAYGAAVMFGLRTWWVDAVGTRLLVVHVSPRALAVGAAGGLAAALAAVVWAMRAVRDFSPRALFSGTAEAGLATPPHVSVEPHGWSGALRLARGPRAGSGRGVTWLPAVVIVIGVAVVIAAATGRVGQVAGFFGGGLTLLAGMLGLQSVWLRRDLGALARVTTAGWASIVRLGWRSAAHRPLRAVVCVTLIATATFLIVAVDAFRRDDRGTGDRRSGTGGYGLMAESLLPVHHDLSAPEGRDEMNLGRAAIGDADAALVETVGFVGFRLRPGDDASCLNLYVPRDPRVLGVPPRFVEDARFSFQASLADTPRERANPWELLDRVWPDGAVSAIADATSLQYVLHARVGDVLEIGGSGARLRIVAALADSVFQSELLVSERSFLTLFPSEEGSRVFLIDAPREPERVAGTLEARLAHVGLDVVSTAERLAAFHRVENTYLATFQALGALGLLLGTVGLGAVLLRNVLERRRELALLGAVGFNRRHLSAVVLGETVLLLALGLATGTACALVAVAPALTARGGGVRLASVALLLAGVAITGLAAALAAARVAVRLPMVEGLRSE